MATHTPTEIHEKDLKSDLEFERHEEIDRLLKELNAKWDEEDFMDLPPKNLPTEP